jgi:hypothetical protein
MLLSVLRLLLAVAPAWPTPLPNLVRQLEEGRCEQAFELASQVRAPAAPTPESIAAGRAIARAEFICAADPALSVSFTELALRLAPDDVDVQLEHAQDLMALGLRAEASALLERALAHHPDRPLARLLLGQLAADESDWDLAIRTLQPLCADPAFESDAVSLIASCQQELGRRQQDLGSGGLASRIDDALRQASLPPLDSGKVLATCAEAVGLGQERAFVVDALRPGELYLFRARGVCSRESLTCELTPRLVQRTHGRIVGVDFAVEVGRQPPRQLSAGHNEPEDNELTFVADAEEIQIRIFDRSRSPEPGVSCTFDGFEVVVP